MPSQTSETPVIVADRPQMGRFEDDYVGAIQQLRGVLIEAYQAVGADPESPREAARDLGIDKTLSWKLSRIINEETSARVAASIPGASAVKLALKALGKKGANAELVARVKSAFDAFDDMVEVHTGDREALALLLDSMAFSGPDRLEKSRKLAFKGNSGIWGAQARGRLNTSIIAPSVNDPSMLDFAQVGGYVDLQRLRPQGAWPLFRFRNFNDDGTTVRTQMQSLGDGADPRVPLLLSEFTSGEVPSIEPKEIAEGLVYELSSGPVGRTGLCSLFCGYKDPASLSRYSDEQNQLGEVLCPINLPIEMLVMDMFVHRDIANEIDPTAIVYGRASGEMNEHENRDERTRLPIGESLKRLGQNPVLATPHIPRYTELAALAFERCKLNLSEFVGWRLAVPYPPMTSTVGIRFELPRKPAG